MKQTVWDIIVVGAGASGILSSVFAAEQGARVLLLEQNDKIGKKIYATGNGRCNFSNEDDSLSHYYGDRALLQSVFSQFSKADTLAFFSSVGIYPKNRNGYYYPHSLTAESVVRALSHKLKKTGVAVRCGEPVMRLLHTADLFEVHTKNEHYKARRLILATGLLASPAHGSNGSLFDEIKHFGHRFTPLVPALCGFFARGLSFPEIAGVRCEAGLSLFVDNAFVKSDTGELQLTDYGISGIPTFQISHPASVALYEKRDVAVEIDFAPDISTEELCRELSQRRKSTGDSETFLLNGLFPAKLSKQLLIKADHAKQNHTEDLIRAIKHCRITLEKPKGFEQAQVCAGGIKTEQVDCGTLESKLCKGLYFAGELLDADGICGGYNLQWAWSSGVVAGLHAAGAL